MNQQGEETGNNKSDSTEPRWKKILKDNLLMILIIIAVILGFGIGIGINKSVQVMKEPTRTTTLVLLGFPGEILMRMLKMLILPLIVSSLIVGLAALDQQASGRLGLRAVCYYMGTTLLAVILGIILVLVINPGGKASVNTEKKEQKDVIALDSFLDLIRNLFPDNLIAACFQQAKSTVVRVTTVGNVTVSRNKTVNASMYADKTIYTNGDKYNNYSYYNTYSTIKKSGSIVYSSGTNILGLVMFSLAVGMVAGKLSANKDEEISAKAETFINFVSCLNDIVMYLVGIVMWYSPIGIWSLITAKFASMADIAATFESLGMYIVTVIVGLAIHSIVILPGLYFICVRKNPFTYLKGIAQALLTAFGTASSSATLPVTFRCLEENNHVDKRVTRFVLPIGATINMDGTALYEAVAAIFIAQASNYSLNFGQIVSISLTATLASIGAAGIPQAGLVTMLIVLQTVGLPEDSVTLIIAVDWFLDRIRTAVNVLGDSIGAGVVAHLSRKDLRHVDEMHRLAELHHNEKNGNDRPGNSNIGGIDNPGMQDGRDDYDTHV
eukprot:gene7941-8796_t